MIVIADDITGAAEIAGIAFTHGQQVRLLCGCPASCDGVAANETIVIATDTRSMTAAEAAAEVCRLSPVPRPSRFFKKTDSALRGHVVAELSALMEALRCHRAVYLPANPSKGRIIRNGTYFIQEVTAAGGAVRPIADTAFSYDPEFPAKTSVLKERFPDAEAKGILMPDAENEADIRSVLATYDDGDTLFAGAADLFTAMIEESGEQPLAAHPSPFTTEHTLILCGSTQSKPLDLGIPVAPMPREVYDGERGAAEWFETLSSSILLQSSSLILTIPHQHRTGKAVAVRLRNVMAEMTRRIVALRRPDHLVIEGGATAWAALQAVGWSRFDIVQQIAPGVVRMRTESGTLVTLKPGSYPWGAMFSPSANR